MEDEEIYEEDLPIPMSDHDLSPLDVVGEDQCHEEEEAVEEGESMKPTPHTSHEPKLRELLRNLCSFEVKIYSDASKEFVRLLRGDLGGEILYQYIQASPQCTELLEAWKLRQGKPGMAYVLPLISAILGHPFGKSRTSGISRSLDNFARLIFETKLESIYDELKCKEPKRQSFVLSLLASIIRRGMGLASEVAKNFDFKLPVLPKLSGIEKRRGGKEMKDHIRHSTRKSFVGFAMSFLEVGNPRLLRWILQQKDVYSGVLRGLGSDDDETVIYVLSTLRDNVLNSNSLLPPGLRSVLFGSVTLEQLSYISGNPVGGSAADMAHEVLVLVCTDPSNGLMPDSNLKGNPKRLLELMKKLKATEIQYHKDLLLAIVKCRPFLCSAYMDEFPYHLEPQASPLWFAAISLAGDLISSARSRPLFTLVNPSQYSDPPALESTELQCVLKCIVPRAFTRSVINKGLLHSEIFVKHSSLRLLLEALKSLDNLITAIDDVVTDMSMEHDMDASKNVMVEQNGLLDFGSFVNIDSYVGFKSVGTAGTENTRSKKWMSLKEDIQDMIRAVLPDGQVLLKLLSSMSHDSSTGSMPSLKRCAHLPRAGLKKLKPNSYASNENIGIVISGIDSELGIRPENSNYREGVEEMDMEEDCKMRLADIWGADEVHMITDDLKEVGIIFYSKLLDVLTLYLRTMPITLEGSFDFFKILPYNPLSLSVNLQKSLLSLLAQYIGQSPRGKTSIKTPEVIYKHLQPLVTLLISSPVKDIKDQSYSLAWAAMQSTGAFDQNLSEIDAWLSCLPGYNRDKCFVEIQGDEVFGNLSSVVISFLCDSVSTMGNNLFKYLDYVRVFISKLDNFQDISLDFSPLVICILQKCLRLLESDSGTFKLPERSIISLYVCNTLTFLLQTQVDPGGLSGLINLVLTEKSVDEDSKCLLCEWRPLMNLLNFARSILYRQISYRLLPVPKSSKKGNDNSFSMVLDNLKELLDIAHDGGLVGVTFAFTSSVTCASPNDILRSFPLFVIVSQHLFKEHISFLSSVLFLDQTFLASVASVWPDLFYYGLDIAVSTTRNTCRYNDALFKNCNGSSTSKTGTFFISEDLESTESAAVAFCYLLKHAPFHVLFPACMNFESFDSLASTKMLELLQIRLDEGSIDDSILSTQILLFRAYQVRVSFMKKSSDHLERLSHMCFTLIEHSLELLLTATYDSINSESTETPVLVKHVLEVAEIIFSHPIVTGFLLHPISVNIKITQGFIWDDLEDILTLSKQAVHPMEHKILHLLGRVADSLFVLKNGEKSLSKTHVAVLESVVRAFRRLIQQSVLLFKENFDLCMMAKNLVPLLPSFYIFQSLILYMSPFELLELVHWLFCKVDNDLACCISLKVPALSVCLYVADRALHTLRCFLHQWGMGETSKLLWEMRGRSFDISLLQSIYLKILQSAVSFKLEHADLCLLKAVNAVYSQRFMQTHAAVLPLCMIMSRLIISSPLKILTHCIYKTSKTKARILFELTEVSPLHLSLFGMNFLGVICKDLPDVAIANVDGAWPLKDETDDRIDYVFSNEDYMLMLPTALSYFISRLIKLRNQDLKLSSSIPSFYSRILLDGFSNWKHFAYQDIFYEEYEEITPRSMEELLGVFNCSLLGKAVHMLRCFFIFSGRLSKGKQRLDIFDSISSCTSLLVHDQILDCDVTEINPHSYSESANLINRIVAKISLVRLLLFPPESLSQLFPTGVEVVSEEMSQGKGSERENCARLTLTFLNILVDAFDKFVRLFPLNMEYCKKLNNADCSDLFNCLESFILRNIVELSMKIQSFLTQMPSVPFLELFLRSSLLHRFGDSATLKAIRCILVTLKGRFSSAEVLGLLLGHSEFVSTVLQSDSFSESSESTHTSTLLQAMPSIFKVLDNPLAVQNSVDRNDSCKERYKHSTLKWRKLELIKLLRVLFHFKDQQHDVNTGNVVGMNARELLSLLLAGYGATLSEADLEILHLMHEIESVDGSDGVSIAEMDYLWGVSALKLRKEQILDRIMPPGNISECELTEERSSRLFRENIPVDSRLCAETVLHFCYDRATLTAPMSLQKLLRDDFVNTPEEAPSATMDRIQQYDPAFILSFSIHTLLRGYLEPVEFARLGLLAVAFVSISSPDDDIRKLGYESLGSFKKALEYHQNSKDALQLQLLVTFLQNGISEPWQRIPSLTAVFAAEASFMALDPSQNHFKKITKHLMHTSRVDFKSVPLFHTLFESGSIHFKTDRLWILQLLYVGINLNDDAQIFMRKFLFELLMSFYASSLSDAETKDTILQVVKKSVKLHMLARCLVEDCGLIPWLYSVLSICGESLCRDHKDLSLKRMEMVLEVINDVISSRVITKWLQEHALEQISELSSYLHKLLVGSLNVLKVNVSLVNSILHVLGSTLKISQKRMIYKPHFTLSMEGLFQLYQAIDGELRNSRFNITIELGLKTILMSTPPSVIYAMDKAKLSKLVMWAISAALQSSSTERYLTRNSDHDLLNLLEEQQGKESLISKLLRWVTASIILGSISRSSSEIVASFSSRRTKIETLQSLVEDIAKEQPESGDIVNKNNEALSVIILYLQQLLGMNCNILPSIISAFLLLQPSYAPNSKGSLDYSNLVASLCSKIRSPPEANPSWRWSFYQPWKDMSLEQTYVQEVEEQQACQTLLVMFSHFLSDKSLGYPVLSHQDIEDSGLFAWERTIYRTQ